MIESISFLCINIHKVGKGIVITFSRTYDFQLRSMKNVTINLTISIVMICNEL